MLPPGTRLPTGLFPDGMIGGPDTWERQLRLAAYADYSGMPGHQLRLGAGHDDLDLYRTREMRNFNYSAAGLPVPLPAVVDFSASNPFMFPHRRKIDYLYLQDEWRLATDWKLTAGVRHDRYSDFGGTTNPRLAPVWDASYDLTAKLELESSWDAGRDLRLLGNYAWQRSRDMASGADAGYAPRHHLYGRATGRSGAAICSAPR